MKIIKEIAEILFRIGLIIFLVSICSYLRMIYDAQCNANVIFFDQARQNQDILKQIEKHTDPRGG